MATIGAKILNRLGYSPDDRLRLRIGDENAASLESSDPPGGGVVIEASPWPNGASRGGFGTDAFGTPPFGLSASGYGFGEGEFGFGAFGLNDMPRVELEYRRLPADKTALLPVGVSIADALGNESLITRALVGLNDPPVGARGVGYETNGNPGGARVFWTLSPDV